MGEAIWSRARPLAGLMASRTFIYKTDSVLALRSGVGTGVGGRAGVHKTPPGMTLNSFSLASCFHTHLLFQSRGRRFYPEQLHSDACHKGEGMGWGIGIWECRHGVVLAQDSQQPTRVLGSQSSLTGDLSFPLPELLFGSTVI